MCYGSLRGQEGKADWRISMIRHVFQMSSVCDRRHHRTIGCVRAISEWSEIVAAPVKLRLSFRSL
jgi:hypothetical protein